MQDADAPGRAAAGRGAARPPFWAEALSRAAIPAASLAALILLWWAAARIAADPLLLPGPGQVAALAWAEAASGELFAHVGVTLRRAALAFAAAMSAGMAVGMALGRMRGANAAFDPWLVMLLNLPALVVIVLCYIWIGLTETAAVAAVAINKIPLVAAIAREGARAMDPALDDLARIHRLGFFARLRHILLPQMAPHAAAAARTGLALVWKIVLVVEFLGRPDGVGFMIHAHFQMFDVGRVLVYALSFVAVMLVIEMAVLQPMERRARRWREG